MVKGRNFKLRKPKYNTYKPKKKTHKAEEKRVIKIVKEMSLKERYGGAKIFRSDWNGVISAAGTTGSLCTIAQGDNDNQRNGNKIRILGLSVTGEVNLPSSTTMADWNDELRLIFLVDYQCNGAVPSVASILEDSGPLSQYNEDNLPVNKPRRFRVLYDKIFNISASAGGWNGTTIVSGTQRMPFKKQLTFNCDVQFNSTTGAVTEMNTNNLAYLVITSQGAAGIIANIRTFFIDRGTGL